MELGQIDQSLFSAIYGLAGHGKVGDFLIVFFGVYFIYVALAVFLFVAYQDWKKRRTRGIRDFAIAIASALIAKFGIVSLIHIFYHRPRPFLALKISHLITNSTYSFPSGHTTFLFALATATYFFHKKLAYFLFISGVIVGLARVASGVHYPSDILGGVLLGIIAGFVVYRLCRQKR